MRPGPRKLSGLAFKVAADPYIGTLTFYRLYSGKVKAGDMVWNPRSPGVMDKLPNENITQRALRLNTKPLLTNPAGARARNAWAAWS